MTDQITARQTDQSNNPLSRARLKGIRMQCQIQTSIIVSCCALLASLGAISAKAQPPGLEIVVLESPLVTIEMLCMSTDEKLVLSSGLDSFASLRDLKTGRMLRQFESSANRSNADDLMLVKCRAVISGDGSRVAMAQGKSISVFETSSGKLAFTPKTVAGTVWNLGFSHDGSRLLASYDKVATILDSQTGKKVTSFAKHQELVTHAVFSGDGTRAATADIFGTIHIWDPATGKGTQFFKEEKSIKGLAISRNGSRLVVASEQTKLWDTETGKAIWKLPQPAKPFQVVSISDDGQIVAAGDGNSVTVWKAETDQPINSFPGKVTAIQLNNDGSRIAIGYGNQEGEFREVTSQKVIQKFDSASGSLGLDFIGDSGQRASNRYGRNVKIWDPASGRFLTDPVKSLHVPFISDDENRVFAGDNLIDFEPSKIWNPFETAKGKVTSTCMSRDGRRVARREAGEVIVQDAETGREINRWKYDERTPGTISLSRDGTILQIREFIWRVSDGELIQQLDMKSKGLLNGGTLSPDAKLTVGNAIDPSALFGGAFIGLWDIETGRFKKSIRSNAPSGDYFFTRDGERIFTTADYSSGCPIVMSNAKTGERLGSFVGLTGHIEQVAEIGSEKLVSAGTAGRTLVWEPNGKEVCRFIHVGTAHDWICVTPAGYFDCPESGRGFVGFRKPGTLELVEDEQAFRYYHRLKLFARLLAGEREAEIAKPMSSE